MPLSKNTAGELLLHVYVQPGAKKTEISGLHGEALKIRIHAPATESKANEELVKFLENTLGTKRISIQKGHKNRNKILVIQGIDLEKTEKLLGIR